MSDYQTVEVTRVGITFLLIRTFLPVFLLPLKAALGVYDEVDTEEQAEAIDTASGHSAHEYASQMFFALSFLFIPLAIYVMLNTFGYYNIEAKIAKIPVCRLSADYGKPEEKESEDVEANPTGIRLLITACMSIPTIIEESCCIQSVMRKANEVYDDTSFGKMFVPFFGFFMPCFITLVTTFNIYLNLPAAMLVGIIFAYEGNLSKILDQCKFMLEVAFLTMVLESLELERNLLLVEKLEGFQTLITMTEQAEEAAFLSIYAFHIYGFTHLIFYESRSTGYKQLAYTHFISIIAFYALVVAKAFSISLGVLLASTCAPIPLEFYVAVIFRLVRDIFDAAELRGTWAETPVIYKHRLFGGIMAIILFLMGSVVTTLIFFVRTEREERQTLNKIIRNPQNSSAAVLAGDELKLLCNIEDGFTNQGVHGTTFLSAEATSELYIILSIG